MQLGSGGTLMGVLQAESLPGLKLRERPRTPPLTLLSWLLLAAIALLVAYPLLTTVIRILADAGTGTEVVGSSGLDASLLGVLANTIILVVASTLVALLAGAVLAWINERTDGSLRTV